MCFSFKPTNKNIPIKLIKEIINNELTKIEDISLNEYINPEKTNRMRAKIFSLIWDETYQLTEINSDELTISVSRNGSNGIKEVYSKIGLPNIISEIPDYCQLNELTQINIPIVNKIDSIIHIRNNIIHEDATPMITYQDIELDIKIIKYFVSKINRKLNNSLKHIKNCIV